ncbi:MAG: hypothetical protein M1347_05780 [Chloroflexi bacterium]|nr:hypothetical protein [Chloroflexota bacterium]
MAINSICSFLVSPGKHVENPDQALGVMLALRGHLFEMLNGIYEGSEVECEIPIRFVTTDPAIQHSVVRADFINYFRSPGVRAGRFIAHRLRDVTTNKSGLGLLFLILGQEAGQRKFVLSRFPADVGILAEAQKGGLRIDFLERIFMKNAQSYKAALYLGRSLDADFWNGSATDKQVNASNQQIAYYWIKDFLASDFFTTAQAGTRRIARAIRSASGISQDKDVKHDLVAFARFVQALDGQRFSINQLFQRFNLPQNARESILSVLPGERTASDVFAIDAEEFRRHASFASVELDTGAMMIAPSDQFEDVFEKTTINENEGVVRFATEGKIVDERVRGRK